MHGGAGQGAGRQQDGQEGWEGADRTPGDEATKSNSATPEEEVPASASTCQDTDPCLSAFERGTDVPPEEWFYTGGRHAGPLPPAACG